MKRAMTEAPRVALVPFPFVVHVLGDVDFPPLSCEGKDVQVNAPAAQCASLVGSPAVPPSSELHSSRPASQPARGPANPRTKFLPPMDPVTVGVPPLVLRAPAPPTTFADEALDLRLSFSSEDAARAHMAQCQSDFLLAKAKFERSVEIVESFKKQKK